jgi:hypothetical protein
MRAHVVAVMVVVCALAPVASAQETKVVTVGPEYAAGGAQRFWLGDGYRELWTTPVRLPVLDLKKEGGGLTPVRQVGQAQSVGLAMKGADGRSYTFRSLHKEPERMLPEPLRETVLGKIAKDLTAGTHPAAGVIAPMLADAAGIPHTSARLVVMPDDPALGEFAKTFANLIGTIEEYPLPASGGNPGFMGATEIISSTQMWKRWMEGPQNRIDTQAYLRARVVDLWVDNYDRHRGQWRWMRLPGTDAWQPLPEDPDFVLVHRDGMVARSIRTQVPQYLVFSEKYPGRLDGALLNSAEMDRWVLAGASAADFEAMARELQSRLTDEAIERALRQMPPEWYAVSGADTAKALQKRRTGLVDYLLRVYRYYAKVVDIHATDRNERVSIARAADGSIEVTVALADGAAEPYYRRTFVASETDEIRVFLHGGDDRVERAGQPGGPITVRVVAGGGRDVIDDSKSGGTDVWRDAGTADVSRGQGTHVRQNAWPNPVPVKDAPWIEPRSYGHWSVPAPVFGYAPDVLIYLGYGFTRTAWGFRTSPAKSVQTLRGAVTTGDMAGKIEYVGTFRRPASGFGYQLEGYGSGVQSFNYFGPGNNSPETNDRSRYKTRENVFFLTPTLRYEAGRRVEAFVGPELRYSQTPTDAGTIVAEQAPLGVGDFGLVALRAGLNFDSRERAVVAARADYTKTSFGSDEASRVNGVRLQASGFVVPKAWDVDSQYGGVDGDVAAYLGNPRAHLAVRAGGRKLWGDYPWFDAAHVGGANNRGYRSRRFSGDASLFGSASLRVWLGDAGLRVVALRFGLIGFGDVGRVWVDGEDSKAWHSSFGGGLLVQPLGAPFMLHAIAANSKEGTRFYVGMGYPF